LVKKDEKLGEEKEEYRRVHHLHYRFVVHHFCSSAYTHIEASLVSVWFVRVYSL
jgi:hypothetical protein